MTTVRIMRHNGEIGLLGWAGIAVASSAALAVVVHVICWAVRS